MRYFKYYRSVGFALVIATLMNFSILAIAMLSAPVRTSVDLYFSEAPDPPGKITFDPRAQKADVGPELPDCFWMPLDDPQAITDTERMNIMPSARVRCIVPDGVEDSDDPRSSASLSEQFDATPGWERAGMTIRVYNLPPGLDAFMLVMILVIPVSWMLLRGLHVRGDLERAAKTGVEHPWVLLVAPAAALAISSLGSMAMPTDPARQEHAVELLASIAPTAWLIVFALPFVEEAVFRQWLYVRIIDHMPVWVAAAASSWAFMLLHVFNPQAGNLAVYLPTVFAIGMILFWLRHRFQSFSLAVAAHMSNNGLFLAIAALSGQW